ncbi:ABC transporter permease [Cryptosporangium minutisporangium]|uniref:Exporter of polyketide antibiotics n=1 Tax=Cryptosporangium minutisporangium TaxID=113569 RepID=A0ABP6T062_9ACTN
MTAVASPPRPADAPTRSGRGTGGLSGTGTLFRLALRRDRVRASAWTLGIVLFVYSQAAPMKGLYPTQADLDRFAGAYSSDVNPGLVALTGPPRALNTYGGATAWQVLTFAAVLLGLMSYLLVVRHTRAEEEAGRSDLVDAGPVGRYARLTAALLFVGLLNLLILVLSVAALLTVGGIPFAGALALMAGCVSVGLVFATVGALTAQLTEHARTASSIAGAVLGAAFLLRAAGDSAAVSGSSGSWMSWLSPIGWAEAVRPFAGNRWWVLLIPAVTVLLLLTAVVALRMRRDAGAGIFRPGLGPAVAPRSLSGPFGLAWRLQRGSIIGWAVGAAIGGAAFGALAQDMVTAASNDPETAELLREYTGAGGSLADVYLSMIYLIMGMIVAGYAVGAVLRTRTEEESLRAEPVLAGAVSRVAWAGAHVLWVTVGSAVVLVSAGLATGVAHGIRTDAVGSEAVRQIGAALGQLPAVLVLAAVAVALFGLLPRLAAVSWAVLLVAIVIGQFGEFLQLPGWLMNLSPFTHVPTLPGALPDGASAFAPYAWLLALAAVLAGVGLAGFRRRDIG